MCLLVTAAVSPGRENENWSSNVSECSWIFKIQAGISSFILTLAVVKFITEDRCTQLKYNM